MLDREALLIDAHTTRMAIEAMTAYVPDTFAVTIPRLFPLWDGGGHAYAEGERVQHGGVLYRCLTGHTSQDSWRPDTAPSLWVRVDDPAVEWPEWRQPAGSTDAYSKGAKVSHNGKHWVSDVEANVWEPGVSGWTEVPDGANL